MRRNSKMNAQPVTWRCSIKKGILKNFAENTCVSLFLAYCYIKKESDTVIFLFFKNIFEKKIMNTFFKERLSWLLLWMEICLSEFNGVASDHLLQQFLHIQNYQQLILLCYFHQHIFHCKYRNFKKPWFLLPKSCFLVL